MNDYTKKLGKVIEINEAHTHDPLGEVKYITINACISLVESLIDFFRALNGKATL